MLPNVDINLIHHRVLDCHVYNIYFYSSKDFLFSFQPYSWDTQAGMGAQMVQMLCFNQLTRMDDWNHPIVGQHLEEWEEDKECQLPQIDSWARQCLPMEIKSKKPDFFDDKDFKASLAKQRQDIKSRSSEIVLLSIQESLDQRRNSTQLQKKPRRATEVGNPQVESDKLFRNVKKWAAL
jgi:hypothetical protein